MAWIAKVTIGEQEEKANSHSMIGSAPGFSSIFLRATHLLRRPFWFKTGEAKAKQHGRG